MKLLRWIKNALLLAAVAALIVASHFYLDRPLVVEYGGWRVSPPASVAAAAAAIAFVLLALALKLLSPLFFFPAYLARWKEKRAEKSRRETLEEGVRALALDDHRRAFKTFSRLARQSDPDGAFAWLAAAAAEKSDDRGARDEWLRRAADSTAADIAAAAKAELATAENRDDEAFKILSEAGAPGGSPLLAKMYLRAARRREQWPQALSAAYRLRDGARARKWELAAFEIAETALAKTDDIAALRSFWKNNVAAAEQKNPPLLAAYIRALHRLGDDGTVAETLERAVKIAGDSPAILSAVAEMGAKKTCETAFAAAQERGDDKTDPEYLRAAAMLAGRLKLWGRARRYYQMANSLRPDPRNARALEALEAEMRPDSEDDSAPARP
ncbi:MAG: heme biosynthesis protein HemY [Gammaproteobacteria bacterium]